MEKKAGSSLKTGSRPKTGSRSKTGNSPKSGGEIRGTALNMLRALLCSYIVTGVLLLILTLLLYKAGLSEGNVNAGIILIYLLSTFAGGFAAGKMAGRRKFLWGLLLGVLYFLLLVLISAGVYHSLESDGGQLLTTFLLCAGGGMLGGMIS